MPFLRPLCRRLPRTRDPAGQDLAERARAANAACGGTAGEIAVDVVDRADIERINWNAAIERTSEFKVRQDVTIINVSGYGNPKVIRVVSEQL
jgi:hypothetical protein